MPKLMTDEEREAHYTALADALQTIDPDSKYSAVTQMRTVSVGYSDPPKTVERAFVTIERNGKDLDGFSIDAEYTKIGWRTTANGKYRLSLDSYGWRDGGRNAKSLPQRKDGTFDYASAAQHILGHVRYRERRDRERANIETNCASAEFLREKVGYLPGVQISASDVAPDKPITLSLRAEMSLELAEKILVLYMEHLPKDEG